MNATILFIGAGIILFSFMAGMIFLRKKQGGDANSFLMLQQQLQELTKTIDVKLGESSRVVHESLSTQFTESAKIIRDVTERLAKLDETKTQIVSFADQLRTLEDILKNPKQRGILGEYFLETLLKNVFAPGMYQMQYAFSDGEIVDAVIFVKDKVIPIDSKFSLENYNRIREEADPIERERLEKIFRQDLKNRIDETAKYIRPEEGTFDFAFMFIPAEGIYYDLLVNQIGSVKTNTRDLIDYAFIEKRVHIVSATTFLSHLKMLMQGLRAMQIEESAKEIQGRVEVLEKHLKAFAQFLGSMGKSLETTVNHYNKSSKEFRKIDKDIMKITGASQLPHAEELEGPHRQEDLL